MRCVLGQGTTRNQTGAVDQKRLRSIKAQVVIKATLFLTVMYLILEAINYYYY